MTVGISRDELAAMEAADREIEETFRMTQEDFLASGERDRAARFDQMDQKTQQTRLRERAYYQAHAEERRAYRRKRSREHPEREAAWNRAWREANKEHIAAYGKAYRESHKEQIQAKNKAYGPGWYQRNKERVAAYNKAYREKNREKLLAYDRERHRKKKEERDGKAGALRAVRVLAQGERGQGVLENVPEVVPADA